MLGRIAKLYYEYGLTHQEIAELIGWSRVKVTRALAEAREQGIVQVTVLSDTPIFVEEEQALRERFGLSDVWVGPPVAGPDGAVSLATIGSECISQAVTNGMQVAVGLSTTLADIAATIKPVAQPQTTFVPLQGTNPGLVTPPTPSNIARVFASAFAGQAHALAAPVFASSREVLDVLCKSTDVRDAFDTARKSDLALVGVGGTAMHSSIILNGNLGAEDAEELRAAGAVGDINARFFDAEGHQVEIEKTSLVLGLSLDEFKDIPVRIAAAAGPLKVEALRGAIRGGLITGLITDEPTAVALLNG